VMTMTSLMTDEVQDARNRGVPLVALETTLVSHGFPGGEGVQVALAAETRVREAGAVPATIGLVDGVLRIGLTESDLKRFASAGVAARKVGARDLAACLEQDALGATTVGGTLAVCRLAGIRFMATGGTGGVHRGFATVPDISADLPQIARTQALVVSSGVKPSWTWRPPRNCWRPSPSRCWAGAPARSRCSTAPRAVHQCPRW
jgi:pseudouridylate synthase